MTISAELLAILVCPACKGKLDLKSDGAGLSCPACRLIYPVRAGIPVLLAEEAVRDGVDR